MATQIKVSNTRSGNPGRAGWNAILPDPAPARSLEESITTDWLVIGGGFAGLAAARRLSKTRPDDRVVVLEALRVGEGPAGRSSGFMIDLPHDISAESYTSAIEHDMRQTRMNRFAIDFAAEAAEEYGFSKETFDPRGKINVAAGEKGHHHNLEYADYLAAMGESFTKLDAADMKRISGTDYYVSGLHTPGAVMIQPAGFVREMAIGLAQTIDIFEESPVISMTRQGDAWLVKTPQGQISVPKVILAVNGHIQSFGFFKQRLMHVFLYASMTRALTDDEIKRLGGEPTWEFVPADPLGSTVRRISGQSGTRVLMRNRFRYSASVEASERTIASAARDHDRSMNIRFPTLKGVEMEHRWGGRLCLSWYSTPVFGEIESGLFAACCQNGLGASNGILSGILAADHAATVENPYLTDYLEAPAPTRLPPEPFSTIGATVYLRWKEWRAGREK
ncbi:MAG: FAD-binding oxidoreductase [Chloroflexota bacterium]